MITPSYDLARAAFIAQDWHGGQASALYRLGCAQWAHLTRDDIAEALAEFEDCRDHDYIEITDEEAAELDDAIDALRRWLAANPPEGDA